MRSWLWKKGIGPACAVRLRAAMEFSRLLSMPDESNPPMVQSPEDAAALLLYPMQKLEQEHMIVLLLNTRNRLIGEPVEVYHGSMNSNLIRVSELLRPAVRANAASIIIAHNHPSGDPTASPEDVSVTRAIVEAGKMLDIEVLDHIIIGGGGRFISMKSHGLGFN